MNSQNVRVLLRDAQPTPDGTSNISRFLRANIYDPTVQKARSYQMVHKCLICKEPMGFNPWKKSSFSRLAHLECVKAKKRVRGGSR